MRKRICHIITGLPRAGAQRVLVDLLAHRNTDEFDAEVISLLPRDVMADDIEALGVPVWCAGLQRSADLPLRVGQLALRLRASNPDLIHTWMYHGDVVGGMAAKAVRSQTPVVWHLHHSTLDFDRFRASTRALATAAAPLSKVLPASIISCAESARKIHVELGYAAEKMVVIRNGVDAQRFRPRPDGPRSLVAELGLKEPVQFIGMAARFHPQKDHANFLAAAQLICEQRRDVHFILFGAGIEERNPAFTEAALSPQVHLLGERRDVEALLPQLDISTLSSAAGEACSLVLLESMAAGIPAVTTDVGDSSHLVGSTGRVVPPRDPRALATAWMALLQLSLSERRALSQAARARVLESFTLAKVASTTEEVYRSVIDSRRRSMLS